MARTAITLAKSRDGKWKLLSNPDDSLVEQKKNFYAFRAQEEHEEFSEVVYQESDGHMYLTRFLTPEQKKAHDDQNAKDHAEHQSFLDAQNQKEAKRKEKIEENLKPKSKKK